MEILSRSSLRTLNMSNKEPNSNNNGPSNKQELLVTLGIQIGEIKGKIDTTQTSLLLLDNDEEHREFFYKIVLEDQGKLGEFESMKEAGNLDDLLPLVKGAFQMQLRNYNNRVQMLQAQVNALNQLDSSCDGAFENLKKKSDE